MIVRVSVSLIGKVAWWLTRRWARSLVGTLRLYAKLALAVASVFLFLLRHC